MAITAGVADAAVGAAATTTGTMTDHVARLYAVALAIVVFSLTWAVVAARPWTPKEKDPRLAALERRELRLRRESVRVQRLVNRRFAQYEVRLRDRQAEIAATAAAIPTPVPSSSAPAPAAPSVSVVSSPPVTATASS
jgi:hypothetical protein